MFYFVIGQKMSPATITAYMNSQGWSRNYVYIIDQPEDELPVYKSLLKGYAFVTYQEIKKALREIRSARRTYGGPERNSGNGMLQRYTGSGWKNLRPEEEIDINLAVFIVNKKKEAKSIGYAYSLYQTNRELWPERKISFL